MIGLPPAASPLMRGMRVEAQVYRLVGDLLDGENAVGELRVRRPQSIAQLLVNALNPLMSKQRERSFMIGQKPGQMGEECTEVAVDFEVQSVFHLGVPFARESNTRHSKIPFQCLNLSESD
jgi:hypothetical protein